VGEPMEKLDPNRKYTYADYLTWPDEIRCEIIDGVIWDMSAAPNMEHQRVSGEIFGIFWQKLKGKPCRVFAAPFDVRLDVVTVVQPDIAVICDKKKIEKSCCNGAPDIVIEILSPSTGFKDETEKMSLYEKYGVKEYWIVNPGAQYIMIYRLNGDTFDKPEYLKDDDIIRSVVLKGIEIPLPDIFKE
jgi:Uma2 family endonuclease